MDSKINQRSISRRRQISAEATEPGHRSKYTLLYSLHFLLRIFGDFIKIVLVTWFQLVSDVIEPAMEPPRRRILLTSLTTCGPTSRSLATGDTISAIYIRQRYFDAI